MTMKELKRVVKTRRSIESFHHELSDKIILKLIEEVRDYLKEVDCLIQQGSPVEENNFFESLNSYVERLNHRLMFIKEKKSHYKIKKIFRNYIQEYLLRSPLFRLGYLKPKGYSGDFMMLEGIYNNRPIAKDVNIGYFLDKYFLQVEYVNVVRERKDKMKEILKGFINKNSKKNLKILNLACGGCRELRELFLKDFIINKKINFVLVDQDKECLDFSKRELLKTAPNNFKFNFEKRHVLFCLQNDEFLKRYGDFDLIYSIGLVDYLPDAVLGALIKCAFYRITSQGKVIIAHKNVTEYPSLISDWMCDWNFVPRNTKDIRRLVDKNIAKKEYKINFEFMKGRLVFYFMLQNQIK